MRIKRFRDNGMGKLVPLKRKVILCTIYYYDDEPITWDFKDEQGDGCFLNDAIEDALQEHNPNTEVFDVCIDHLKQSMFRGWYSKYVYRILRGRDRLEERLYDEYYKE
jgi:hypothetical protein